MECSTATLELPRPVADAAMPLLAAAPSWDHDLQPAPQPVIGSPPWADNPLVETIAWLLATATGPKSVKKLFCRVLRLRKAHRWVSLVNLPEGRRDRVGQCLIFARSGGLRVCHAPLLVSELSQELERPVLHALARKLTRKSPAALVVFSNLSGTNWDFHWVSPGLKLCVARLRPSRDANNIGKLARLLARFADADAAAGRVEAGWERARRFDEFLRGAVARRRERRRRACAFANDWLRPSPLLSLKEQLALLRRWRSRGDAEARQQIVLANLYRVRRIAKQFRRCGLELDDLHQEACLGLLHALDTYQTDGKLKLSTCMNRQIRSYIRRAFWSASSVLAVPRHLVDLNAQWDREVQRIIAATGRTPSPTELQRALYLSRPDFRQLRDARRVLNGPNCRAAVPEELADETDTRHFKRLDWDSVHQGIEQALRTLPPRSAKVIRLRFGFGAKGVGLTLEEVAGRFKQTRQNISQVEQRTIARLRFRLKRLVHGD